MKKSTFKIAKMDCPSEERLIKIKLEGSPGIHNLEFDLNERTLYVFHSNSPEEILQYLSDLKLGASLISSNSVKHFRSKKTDVERKTLIIVLMINFSFFLIELITGLISKSMGLVADSLDMLADSIVYAMALFAVGGTVTRKKRIAGFAGYFQFFLAMIGFFEVIRRFAGAEIMPDFKTMIIVSGLALIANVICLYLLQKNKSKEAHMQASLIFTSNDIIINSGVILAAVFVNLFNSSYPDLIIGAIVFIVVARGAYRILQISK